MELKPVKIDISAYPTELHLLLSGGKLYDSSCSPERRVIFIISVFCNINFLGKCKKMLTFRREMMYNCSRLEILSAAFFTPSRGVCGAL